MTKCRLCDKTIGAEHEQEIFFICPKCYTIVAPIIEVRIEQLARLQRRRESATADKLKQGDW